MPRLSADADPTLWVAVTESWGFRGRRHRRKAIGMLLSQATAGLGGIQRPGSGFAAWAISQAVPGLIRKAAGRWVVWVWRADPELLVVSAQIQELTPQVRTARAMLPIEYDDTVPFSNPYLGVGEKLEMGLPKGENASPFATYTWDTGTHLITLTAVCADRGRFGVVLGDVDALARTLRLDDDLTVGESGPVLRIDPA